MRPRELRSEYYQDRWSEYDLCNDFPGDEVLIDGLHALQTHLWNRGINIDIPVVRVMNTAHFLVCYMFATTCSGDQREYDALTYGSVGQDKQLTVISLIVLAAMLKRTDGMRARNCRSVLLEDRSEDFYEGVSLYERFLESGEAHFAQEDFESDIMREIKQRDEIIAQQASQIMTMQKTIKEMNQQNNQFNNCVIYQAPVYNTNNTTNNYYPQPAADPIPKNEDIEPVAPANMPPKFFCVSEKFSEQNIRDRLAAELSHSVTKRDYCRALYQLQHIGCINIDQYASDAKRAEVFNEYQSTYKLSASDFCKARASQYAQN